MKVYMLDKLDPMHPYAFVGIHNASLGEKEPP